MIFCQIDQTSDLYTRLHHKTTKSLTNINTTRTIGQCIPKVHMPKVCTRNDKTICNEEELKKLQKSDNSLKSVNNKLNLNRPYLKSASDLTHLSKSLSRHKNDKHDKHKKR